MKKIEKKNTKNIFFNLKKYQNYMYNIYKK